MPLILSLSAPWEAIFGEGRERTTTRSHAQRRTDVLIPASQKHRDSVPRNNNLGGVVNSIY